MNPFTILSSLFCCGAAAAEPLQVGANVPSIAVTDHESITFELSERCKQGLTLIYFFPKADTPGWTKQACNLRDEFAQLQEANIQVLGVSGDSIKNQNAFHTKYKLPFHLLADPEAKLMKAFGVPVKFGKFAARQSFLIQDGKIIWRDLKATPKSQAQDALKAAEKN